MPGDVVRPDDARPQSGRTLLIAAAGDLAAAAAAVLAGADVVDLGVMSQASVALFRSAHPDVPVCTDTGPGDIVRDPQAAEAAGARLLCPGRDAARATGLPRDLLLVQAPPARLPGLVAAGWAVLVDADQAAGMAAASSATAGGTPAVAAGPPAAASTGAVTSTAAIADILAVATVSCWLGAAAVRTGHVAAVRRALDMTASIAGVRPPAAASRGLA